jgi:GNAT superfamily N-acetyltransferase
MVMIISLTCNIKTIPASEANAESLQLFYKKMYPLRYDFLKDNWNWLNRSSYYNNQVPLVVICKDQVIGHGGLIPVNLQVINKTITATWFIDLAVLPEFRGQGLGNILVKKRMEFAEMQMTFPNDNSYRIFKKLGWIEHSSGFMHYIIILPFNHPRFAKWLPSAMRRILNIPFDIILGATYTKYAKQSTDKLLLKMDDRSLLSLYKQYENAKQTGDKAIIPVRDKDFINWRITKSPNREGYYIYSTKSFSALFYLNECKGNCIDILLLSDGNKLNEIRNMLSTVALFGKARGSAYIRIFTTRIELSEYIKKHLKSILKIRKFYFTSRNIGLLKECMQSVWDLELIDSDFEYTK